MAIPKSYKLSLFYPNYLLFFLPSPTSPCLECTCKIMNAMIAFQGGVIPDPSGLYVHVQAKQMVGLTLSTGNSKNHCTA